MKKKFVLLVLALGLCVATFAGCDTSMTPPLIDDGVETKRPAVDQPEETDPGSDNPGEDGSENADTSHEHTYGEDDTCTVCGKSVPYTKGMSFKLNADGKSYMLQKVGDTTSRNIYIPKTYHDKPVTAIDPFAFEDKTIASLYIPSTVTSWDLSKVESQFEVILGYGRNSISNFAFKNCGNLTGITIPSTVKSMGESAFYACKNLSDITIPNSVTDIGKQAFYGCSALTELIIPDGVTSIGEQAFGGCRGLTSVTISDRVTSMGVGVFHNCDQLKSITLPAGITNIEVEMFYGCSALQSITIPAGVTSIEGSAFLNCSNLVSATLPDGMTNIGEKAFSGCASLNTIHFGGSMADWDQMDKGPDWDYSTPTYTVVTGKESEIVYSYGMNFTRSGDGYRVTGIGTSTDTDIVIPPIYKGLPVTGIAGKAFYENAKIKSVTIPDSVTSIGGNAFGGCSRLATIHFTGSMVEWDWIEKDGWNGSGIYTVNVGEESDMVYTFGMKYTLEGEEYIVSGIGTATDTRIVIPSVYRGLPVTGIRKRAFYDCKNVTSIVIPDSVTNIDSYAFAKCTSLTSIVLPSGLLTLNDHIFLDCTSLTSVTIPNGVRNMENGCFDTCSSLTTITIPKSVKKIGDFGFDDCTSLSSIRFGGTMLEWDQVSKGYFWNMNMPDYTVYCSDGQV